MRFDHGESLIQLTSESIDLVEAYGQLVQAMIDDCREHFGHQNPFRKETKNLTRVLKRRANELRERSIIIGH